MHESERLAFIEQRDGKEATIKFAKDTYKMYRMAIKRDENGKRTPYGGAFRRKLIISCLQFRAYIRENRNV